MKKRVFLLFAFILFGGLVIAQQAEWSNMERFRNRTAYNRIIGSNDEGYYVLRSRDFTLHSKVIIERYRENMALDYSKKIPDMRGTLLVNAFVNGAGITLWKSRYNARSEKLELFIEHLDEEADPLGRPMPMALATPKNNSDDGDFVVSQNMSKSHYVVLFTEKAPHGKNYLTLQVYNKGLERISSRRELMDFGDREFQVEQILADTLGNAFVLISGINPDIKRGEPERVGVHLFALTNTDDWYDFYLNFEDTYIQSPIMALDEVNDGLTVSGLYSLHSRNQSRGTMNFSIQRSDFKIKQHNFIPFSRDFIRDIAGDRAAQRDEELSDFVIRNMVMRTDGGYILFGEEFAISQQSYTYYVNGIAQVNSKSVYNYGKLFVVSVGPDAIQEWTKVIYKAQSSVNDFGYYASFSICKRSDRIHILFNDKMKGNGGVLNYTLVNDGTLEDEMLFGNQSSFISVVPIETKQMDSNTLLIPTSKDRKFAIVKLIF